MKICIFGGAGFIGSQLANFLVKLNHTVTIIDNLSYGYEDNLIVDGKKITNFIKDDIRNPDIAKYLNDIEVVFNFAAIAPLPVNQSNPFESYSINVAGFGNILEACRKAKIPKIVFASTSAVYENNTSFPVKETDQISPYLTYSLTKKHCEDLVNSYCSIYDMDITTLRFFNVYGPHHDFRRKSPPLIAYIIKCLMSKEIPILHSDGSQKRDYVYIEDVCRMCEMVMSNPKAKGETFNVCSNSVISMNDIYEKISNIIGSDIKPIFRNPSLLWDKYSELYEGFSINPKIIEKETNKFCLGSYEKAKIVLGWEPKFSFDEGIKKTVKYALSSGL